jgi:hypothetical protein
MPSSPSGRSALATAFWWSLISGEEATRTGLAGLQEDARDASTAIAARLDAVRAQLDNVVTWSDGQMTREETSGGSCGTSSGAGRGPLYNARRSVRDSVTTLRDGMTRAWLEPVRVDVEELRATASTLEGGSIEDRQKAFEAKASDIRGKARSIAARSNELGKSTAAEMRALAKTVTIPPGRPGFSCFDPTLAERLEQAANQADQPAEIKLREAAFSEGPAGVANAVKNLWKNIGAYSSSLVAYIGSGFQRPFSHTVEGDPITGRDLIALLATIGVDLGLLALAILNPPPAATLRPSGEVMHQIRECDPHRALTHGRAPPASNGCAATSSTTTRRPISSYPISTPPMPMTLSNPNARLPSINWPASSAISISSAGRRSWACGHGSMALQDASLERANSIS